MTRTLEVLRPGPLTTVQDAGRTGHRHLGVGQSGALDAHSARIANALVGNADGAALLECTLGGPILRFDRAARIALTGAAIDAYAGGTALPGWRTITLPAGTELRLGACRRGARAYLAIGGGIDVPPCLGSRATDLRGSFGGLQGRALQAGDVLPLGPAPDAPGTLAISRWWIDPSPDLVLSDAVMVRILPGRDATFPADALTAQPWHVSPRSDRQGLQLDGAHLALADARERVSEPVSPGTVQLPPGGAPIVLLADAQTVGGYPRVGHVVTADLPRLAQCRPGTVLRFAPVDPSTAQALAVQQRARQARIGLAIQARQRS